ncbi:IS200/IS605 family transposase [Litoribacter ruber]|uniref:IS200/IS605 family transposase n=1 Tax=Litoribacter ruber TaxID=702568 RepID=UPI001BDB1C36|nr:IS200/IS605 family transposase [Litoribacter ruber]MBT0810710.1 IS200/IS605 family transposase [Litoribacter ruber]
MANTYSSLVVQTVFAVKYHSSMLDKAWRQELFGVIGNLINETDCKTYIVNGVSDYVHCLFGFKPVHCLSDVMQSVKSKSSKWLNETSYLQTRFEWQNGFSAFSYSHGQVEKVYRYIKNQEAHHQSQTFINEYRYMLQKYKVEYDQNYLFHPPLEDIQV